MKIDNERAGYIPYGHRLSQDGIHLEIDVYEQQVIKLIKDLRDEGLTYREIVPQLNLRGIVNRKNKPWSYVAVFELIKKNKNLISH
jgi:hypothetical protein